MAWIISSATCLQYARAIPNNSPIEQHQQKRFAEIFYKGEN